MKFKLPYLLIGFGFTVCALKGTFSMYTVDGSAERCQSHDRRCMIKNKVEIEEKLMNNTIKITVLTLSIS